MSVNMKNPNHYFDRYLIIAFVSFVILMIITILVVNADRVALSRAYFRPTSVILLMCLPNCICSMVIIAPISLWIYRMRRKAY